MVTDPIADMVTSIKNGQAAERSVLTVPFSKLKNEVAKILVANGYIIKTEIKKNKNKPELIIYLGENRIINLRRISKPGRRLYSSAKRLPRPMGGAGVMIVSTSRGLMSDKDARRAGVGGEMICEVY